MRIAFSDVAVRPHQRLAGVHVLADRAGLPLPSDWVGLLLLHTASERFLCSIPDINIR